MFALCIRRVSKHWYELNETHHVDSFSVSTICGRIRSQIFDAIKTRYKNKILTPANKGHQQVQARLVSLQNQNVFRLSNRNNKANRSFKFSLIPEKENTYLRRGSLLLH